MLLPVVAGDSILPPGPNGNLALQLYWTILYALTRFRRGAYAPLLGDADAARASWRFRVIIG